MNTEHMERLKQILREERDIHALMIETARAMQTAIKNRNIGDLQKHSARFDSRSMRVAELEGQRRETCAAIATMQGAGGDHIHLGRIITNASPKERTAFENLRAELRDTVSRLHRINASNRILLREAMTEIDDLFRMMTSVRQPHACYVRAGKKKNGATNRVLVNKIA